MARQLKQSKIMESKIMVLHQLLKQHIFPVQGASILLQPANPEFTIFIKLLYSGSWNLCWLYDTHNSTRSYIMLGSGMVAENGEGS